MTKTAKRTKLIDPVDSLMDLRNRAQVDVRYLQLAIAAANNLGGDVRTGNDSDPTHWNANVRTRALRDAMDVLINNANETDEEGVVDEINYCRDLVHDAPVPAPAPKTTKTKKTGIVNIDLVRDPILATWDSIAPDAMALDGMTNAGAIEMCIDADRMTFFAHGAKGKDAAKAADTELDRAIKAHGYKKVLNYLSRAIRLL